MKHNMNYIKYYYQLIHHWLTCFRCYPGWRTGMNRKQGGRGATDMALIAITVLGIVTSLGIVIGMAIRAWN